jgi:hypothetical protein
MGRHHFFLVDVPGWNFDPPIPWRRYAPLEHLNLVSKNLAALAEVALHSHLQSCLQVLVRTLRPIFESDIRLFVVAHVEKQCSPRC